ncbi:hypothetical protein RND81_08G114200 [Saponaria officinalis]|uniref:Uncharacterized protein n=1 Tax=Saponaria officinalis TaxID=3572 RepID=A0AAW1J744_SAPOF
MRTLPRNSTLDSKHEATNTYTEAGHAYKKTSIMDATSCLEQSLNCFLEIGRLSTAARYCKEIAEIYEVDHNSDQAIFCVL